MAKRGGNFIEEHIEKVVLLIVALCCIYPFYKYVITPPGKFELDGRKFGPGQLDIYISERADQLKAQLDRSPEPTNYSDPCSPLFMAKLEGKWPIDTEISWPVPFSVEQKIEKKYRIPVIGPVKDVAAEHIRAAAYMPKVAVTEENASNADIYEPNDLDLVTVQASIDTGPISESFEECFSGKDIPEQWRDSSLSRPVFAGVQLQRQQLNSEGQWGSWQDVPRIKIDPQREEFRVVEDVNKLPTGGVTIRRLRFENPQMQASLLQPEPYRIASMEETWFPPVLHRKFLNIQREKEAQERREAIANREEQQTEERDRTRIDERDRGRDRGRTERDSRDVRDNRTRTSREPAGAGIAGRGGDSRYPGGGRNTVRTARPDRDRRTTEPTPAEQPNRQPKTADESEIYSELSKLLLQEKGDETPQESLTFWAYDDTAEPGKSYRYRIRIGVFNPIAGRGQVRAEDAAYENKVILWSDFSDVTEPISIPKRVYFFPLSVQEAAKAAEIQVCRYMLGYWYSEQFMVKRGETIGRPAKPAAAAPKPKQDQDTMMLTVTPEEEFKPPETIDYTTGAVLVDLVAENDWVGGKNLQPRQYFNMLYSFDGSVIGRMAAKLMYWPDEIRAKYSEIKALEKKKKVAFRDWSSAGTFDNLQQRGTRTRDLRGRGVEDMRMEEMMRMRMGH